MTKLRRPIASMVVFAALGAALPPVEMDHVDAFAAAIKPPITGLISMGTGGYDPATNDNAAFAGIYGNDMADLAAKRNAFGGMVINIPWREIEPAAGGPLDTAPIDTVLQQIRAYNADPQTTVPLRAILRVWAGPNAPDWAKNLGGPPVTVALKGKGGRPAAVAIGRFWAPDYEAAWRDLQARLAARYDSEPLIAEIANTSCTSADDEWSALAWPGAPKIGVSSIDDLHEAGFSDAAFQRCLLESAGDYAGWRTTPVNLDLGPFRPTDGISADRVPPFDDAFPRTLMTTWQAQLGERAVFANHTLSYPPYGKFVPIYAMMKASGASLEFQTHSPIHLDWDDTVKEAVCLGAHALELWNATNAGGYEREPVPVLLGWSRALRDSTTNDLCPTLEAAYGW